MAAPARARKPKILRNLGSPVDPEAARRREARVNSGKPPRNAKIREPQRKQLKVGGRKRNQRGGKKVPLLRNRRRPTKQSYSNFLVKAAKVKAYFLRGMEKRQLIIFFSDAVLCEELTKASMRRSGLYSEKEIKERKNLTGKKTGWPSEVIGEILRERGLDIKKISAKAEVLAEKALHEW